MDLWIRSQDKTKLIKISFIEYGEYNDIHFINGFSTNGVDNYDLGIYKSKERALEVLDEIQKLFMPTYLISNISKEDGLKLQDNIAFATSIIQTEDNSKIEQINGSIIYQMPEE